MSTVLGSQDTMMLDLWIKHAPLVYQWPHDEPFARWFAHAIPGVFATIREHYSCGDKLVDVYTKLKTTTKERDILQKRIEELEYLEQALGL